MGKKSQAKQQQKIIQDKTFGLKNKNKSKTVQKQFLFNRYCKSVEAQVKNKGKSAQQLQQLQFQKKKQKKKQKQLQSVFNSIYKVVGQIKQYSTSQQQQDDSMQKNQNNDLCPLFKQGLCQKGSNCQYSHDLILQKGVSLDLYIDQRIQLALNSYSQQQLKSFSKQKISQIIYQNQKVFNKQKKSDITCKNFLQAIQKNKYGWKWMCVNGQACQYRHCLPPGYIFKNTNPLKKQQELAIEASIDFQIQNLIGQKGTPVTLQRFLKWKQKKKQSKQKELDEKNKENEKNYKQGKNSNITGKRLFQIDKKLFIDDQEAAGKQIYQQIEQQAQDQQEEIQNLNQQIKQSQQQNQESKQ